MARRHESTKRIEDVTQGKVWAEIRYLDPDPSGAEKQDKYGDVADLEGFFAEDVSSLSECTWG